MYKNILIVVAIVVIGVAGYFLLSGAKTSQPNTSKVVISQNQVNQQKSEEEVSQSTDFDKRFLAYSAENLVKASKDGRAVVFFHASWCPLCSEAEKDVKANGEKVPADVTILKTDYDSSKELKAKYGVVSQDTWVQVDKEGNEITKWNSGGKGLSSLLANLK